MAKRGVVQKDAAESFILSDWERSGLGINVERIVAA